MLDFSRQFAPLREEILTVIAQVCDAQSFILGPPVARFEASAAAVCSVPFAIGCASGTDALWLALAAANIGNSHQAPVPHSSRPCDEWEVQSPSQERAVILA